MGSTFPGEHAVTLSTQHFERQHRGNCVMHTIYNALGHQAVGAHEMHPSRHRRWGDCSGYKPDSECDLEEWLALSDLNAWAAEHSIGIYILARAQHKQGQRWEVSLAQAIQRCEDQLWLDVHKAPMPNAIILHQPGGHFVAVIHERQSGAWLVIDSLAWDAKHNLPKCMPMSNSDVCDKYVGTTDLLNVDVQNSRFPELIARLPLFLKMWIMP